MQNIEAFLLRRSRRLPQRRQEGRRATLDRCFLFSLGYKSSKSAPLRSSTPTATSERWGRSAGKCGSSPVGTAAARNRSRLRGKSETEKYQVRGRERLRVNKEAGKKVEQTRACETRNAMLLQLRFTDSNRKKRKREGKQQQQPSVSPLLISRIREQSHAEKVNCAPRSKLPAKPNQASKAGTRFFHFSSNISSSQLHKAPKYKLNCENEELLYQYRPNIINFASPGRGKKRSYKD